jgi:serine/threonine protein phosphatase PrpC
VVDSLSRSGKNEIDRLPLRLIGAMRTHAGEVRHRNEDTVFFSIADRGPNETSTGALLVVADGMGGHRCGEVASAMAVEHIKQVFDTSHAAVPDLLAQRFREANTAVYRYGQDHADSAGLGTTCTVLAVRNECVFLGHIGDSRAYLCRNGTLCQLTTDHTLVGDLVRSGTMTPSEAASSPSRNVLSKALGTHPEIDPEIWPLGQPLLLDDRLVLCSDGLTDLVNDAQIYGMVKDLSPSEACNALLETALREGGYDNISIGVFRVIQDDTPSEAPKPRPTRPVPRHRGFAARLLASLGIRARWLRLSYWLSKLGVRRRWFTGGVLWTRLMRRGGFLSATQRKTEAMPKRS